MDHAINIHIIITSKLTQLFNIKNELVLLVVYFVVDVSVSVWVGFPIQKTIVQTGIM